jgi:hypothetical protein
MPAKRDKYPKGRRTKPISEGKLMRHRKTAPKTGIRKTRKQRDIVVSGGKRHVKKHPRR